MNANNTNSIFSRLINSNQLSAYSQRLIGKSGNKNTTSKPVGQSPKNADKFVASHANKYTTYQAAHTSSAAYKAMPEIPAPAAVSQATALPVTEPELTYASAIDSEFIKKSPPTVMLSPFNNMVNGHYFSNLNNAKLGGASDLEPFSSGALNKTYQLSNQLFNVNMRNGEGGFSNRDLHGNLEALANAYDIMYRDMTADNNGQTHFLDEAMRSHLYFNAQQSMFATVKYEDYPDEASYIADRDAVLAENIRKADEFADVFLRNYKKHGIGAAAMAFEAIEK